MPSFGPDNDRFEHPIFSDVQKHPHVDDTNVREFANNLPEAGHVYDRLRLLLSRGHIACGVLHERRSLGCPLGGAGQHVGCVHQESDKTDAPLSLAFAGAQLLAYHNAALPRDAERGGLVVGVSREQRKAKEPRFSLAHGLDGTVHYSSPVSVDEWQEILDSQEVVELRILGESLETCSRIAALRAQYRHLDQRAGGRKSTKNEMTAEKIHTWQKDMAAQTTAFVTRVIGGLENAYPKLKPKTLSLPMAENVD